MAARIAAVAARKIRCRDQSIGSPARTHRTVASGTPIAATAATTLRRRILPLTLSISIVQETKTLPGRREHAADDSAFDRHVPRDEKHGGVTVKEIVVKHRQRSTIFDGHIVEVVLALHPEFATRRDGDVLSLVRQVAGCNHCRVRHAARGKAQSRLIRQLARREGDVADAQFVECAIEAALRRGRAQLLRRLGSDQEIPRGAIGRVDVGEAGDTGRGRDGIAADVVLRLAVHYEADRVRRRVEGHADEVPDAHVRQRELERADHRGEATAARADVASVAELESEFPTRPTAARELVADQVAAVVAARAVAELGEKREVHLAIGKVSRQALLLDHIRAVSLCGVGADPCRAGEAGLTQTRELDPRLDRERRVPEAQPLAVLDQDVLLGTVCSGTDTAHEVERKIVLRTGLRHGARGDTARVGWPIDGAAIVVASLVRRGVRSLPRGLAILVEAVVGDADGRCGARPERDSEN